MLPVLLTVGPVRIYAYGAFLFVSLFLGLFYWWRLGREENLEELKLFDAFFLALIWFLIAGRVAYLILGKGKALSWWQGFALLSYPGLVDWVGIVAAGWSLVVFAKKHDWPVMKLLDMAAEVLSAILVGVNLGGLLNGSNPGRSDWWWGVRYVGRGEMRVVPVDLWGVVWFGLSWWLVAKVRREFRFYEWYKGKRGKARDGLSLMVFLVMSGVYYLGRYLLEGGGRRLEMMGVILVLVGLGGAYYLSGKRWQWRKRS